MTNLQKYIELFTHKSINPLVHKLAEFSPATFETGNEIKYIAVLWNCPQYWYQVSNEDEIEVAKAYKAFQLDVAERMIESEIKDRSQRGGIYTPSEWWEKSDIYLASCKSDLKKLKDSPIDSFIKKEGATFMAKTKTLGFLDVQGNTISPPEFGIYNTHTMTVWVDSQSHMSNIKDTLSVD
ncbi:MAG: hypothetical protein GY861_20085 [bacterium]|nr:hypothetical protein [bacterium]